MGASLYCLFVPSGFGERDGFDTNTSYAFPQGVLTALTLLGGGAGDEGAGARARCEPGLPLCSVAITVLLGVWVGLKLLEQKP